MITATVSTTSAYTHDYSLDGDEGLYVGKTVLLTDGEGQWIASATEHLDSGMWIFKLSYRVR